MNLTKLKNYAPQARQAFVQAMTDRAAFYGVTATKIEPVVEKGDVAFIGGREHPRAMVPKRKALAELVAQDGFAPTMEKLAYTWFNRLVAIRYMELHGYLDHGYRVLSHPEGKPTPEILEHAEHVELPGLDNQTVIDLKLDGSKDAQLYRLLLVAQCNALNETLPFLFARIDDEAELLLPDNLLHSESLIRKLVSEITQEDCGSVEILGWLYQFYISERKDEVMARKSAVPTQDIPAVTQLFTPHWIVRYLVENSLGRLWLLNRPGSKLREHMPYYVEGEAETDFLKISKPEDIRLLDPAVGSGHMLTYAFDLLCLIYEEEGYVPSEIPALILRHNLQGLEICPRAAQLAELALVFKAREKSRRFFQPGKIVQPRILALQDIRFEVGELEGYLKVLTINPATIVSEAAPSLTLIPQSEKTTTSEPISFLALLHQFEEATTFGSLIQPCLDEQQIAIVRSAIEAKDLGGQLFLHETHGKVRRVLEQAEMLCQRHHVVVTNPPYMGAANMDKRLKQFVGDKYPITKSDLFSVFIEQGLRLTKNKGYTACVTMQSWMFLSSFTQMREDLILQYKITSCLHIGYNSFPELNSKIAQAVAFVICKTPHAGAAGSYFDLNSAAQSADKRDVFIERRAAGQWFTIDSSQLRKIPSSPLAYWASGAVLQAFATGLPLGKFASIKRGMTTSDNARFLRFWPEISNRDACKNAKDQSAASESGAKWFPYSKGGGFRKWFGLSEYYINWEENGRDVIGFAKEINKSFTRTIVNIPYYFKPSVAFSYITTGPFSMRWLPLGHLYDSGGPGVFADEEKREFILACLNSKPALHILKLISPTINLQIADLERTPIPLGMFEDPQTTALVSKITASCVALAQTDWDNFETSWDFRDLPLLRAGTKGTTLAVSWEAWRDRCAAAICRMQELETENNRLFIHAYGLTDEMKPDVSEEQITFRMITTSLSDGESAPGMVPETWLWPAILFSDGAAATASWPETAAPRASAS